MNKKGLFLIAFVTVLMLFYSCKNDDLTPKPEIVIEELGHENSKVGYPGSDFHIDVDIVAKGKIDFVKIEIHPDGEHKSVLVNVNDMVWVFDSIYTEFSGMKNATFHKHISIPEYAEIGEYHFHFSVTDMEGNQTVVENEIEIKIKE